MDVVLFLLLGDVYFMLGGDLVMDVDDCFILWMIFELSYWGIFPFHLVEMSPYFEPGHFHRSEIPNGVC